MTTRSGILTGSVLGELPSEVTDVFKRYITCEYVTVDAKRQAIAWPVTPYPSADGSTLDITTGIGYPKKADDAASHPRVAQLFSDPTGSGITGGPCVLVQGTATVDDADLAANRERYRRESAEKLPATKDMLPPKFVEGLFGWYFDRIYVKLAPDRVLVWPDGDCAKQPEVYGPPPDAAGHDAPAADATGAIWDARIDELGNRYDSAVLAWEGPDGSPYAVRLPVAIDASSRRIRFDRVPDALPVSTGSACVTAHSHSAEFLWQENFQVRGDLAREAGGLVLIPRKLIGGFELPKESRIAGLRRNYKKARRFARIARRRRRERVAA